MLEYYSEGKVWDPATGFVYSATQDNKDPEPPIDHTVDEQGGDETPKRRGRPRKAE